MLTSNLPVLLFIERTPQMPGWEAETPRAVPRRGCGDLGTLWEGVGLFLRHGERRNRVTRGVGMGSLNSCSEEMSILGANLQESGGFHSLGHDAACSHGGEPIIQ